jgi:hypothetical protein
MKTEELKAEKYFATVGKIKKRVTKNTYIGVLKCY